MDCAACHNVALLTPTALLRAGLSPAAKVLDLKERFRCRGIRRQGASGRFDQMAGGTGYRRWPLMMRSARKCADPLEMEPRVKKTGKSSKTIRANKRKAKLRAKHRRQRARATG